MASAPLRSLLGNSDGPCLRERTRGRRSRTRIDGMQAGTGRRALVDDLSVRAARHCSAVVSTAVASSARHLLTKARYRDSPTFCAGGESPTQLVHIYANRKSASTKHVSSHAVHNMRHTALQHTCRSARYTHTHTRTRVHVHTPTHIDVCMLRRHGRTATRSRSHSTASAAKVPEWPHAPYRAWPARYPALKPDCHPPAALAHGHFRPSPIARVHWASQLVADARPAPALCMRRRAVGRNTTVGGFWRVCLCVKVHRGAVPRAGPQPRVCIRRLLQGTTDPAQPPRAAELGSPTDSERRSRPLISSIGRCDRSNAAQRRCAIHSAQQWPSVRS